MGKRQEYSDEYIQIGERAVRTVYKKANTLYTVNSVFKITGESLEELFFQLILNKVRERRAENEEGVSE